MYQNIAHTVSEHDGALIMHISILVFSSFLFSTLVSISLCFFFIISLYMQLTLNIFCLYFEWGFFSSLCLSTCFFFFFATCNCIKSMIIKCVRSSSLVTYRVSVSVDKHSALCVYFYFQRNGITRSRALSVYASNIVATERIAKWNMLITSTTNNITVVFSYTSFRFISTEW